MKLMFVFNVFDAHTNEHQMQSYIKTLQNDSANQVVEYMLGQNDGYHYTRNIGGKLVTKIVYGNIGKDFKVLDTYDSKLQFD